jgi:NTE family protein
METLILALIASYNARRQQEPVVPEPEEFQPFDLQALRNSAENKPSRWSSRHEAYAETRRDRRRERSDPRAFAPQYPVSAVNDLHTALVLQGGGALGAYEYGVIKALYERRPGFSPSVITGLSIGAVNAAILAGAADPIQTLDKVWREDFAVLFPLPLSRLANQGMYRLRPEYLVNPLLASYLTTSFCDTSPLRTTLERVVDIDRLNTGSQVVVTAVDVASGELVRFGNRMSLQNKTAQFANTDGLTLDHILASCSLPPGFPMTQIDGRCYWDGGLRSNTPLSEAINCLEALKPDNSAAKREVIVIELVPMAGQVPETIQQVTERISSLIFSSELALDQALFRNVNGYIDLFGAVKALVEAIEQNQDVRRRVDAALAKAGRELRVEQILEFPAYKKLGRHRKIDAFTLVPFRTPPEFTRATDFSKSSIEQRIEAGYQEAVKQQIWDPKWVQP